MQKIFGIGLSRTGSTSLHVDLLLMGIPAVHCPIMLARYKLVNSYTAADFIEHDAYTDIPVSVHYKYLDRLFPDALFILTIREEDSWIGSIKNFYVNRGGLHEDLLTVRNEIRMATYGSILFEESQFRQAYREHYKSVISYFQDRPGKLLILDLKVMDSWKVLSDFLNVSAPDLPFPHIKNPHIGWLSSVTRNKISNDFENIQTQLIYLMNRNVNRLA